MRQFVQADDHDTTCGSGTGTVQQASASNYMHSDTRP